MKQATLLSLVVIMFLSLSVPADAAFRVHPANPVSLNTHPVGDGTTDKETTQPVKKKSVFGIIAICIGAVAALGSSPIIAILGGAAAVVLGCIGMQKKKMKLRGLAITGLILGIIAIIGGIILAAV